MLAIVSRQRYPSPLPLPPAPIASYVHSVFRPITPAAAAATNNLSRPNAKPVSDTGIMMPRDAVMRSRPAVRVAAGGAVSLDAAALGLAALKTSFSDGMFAVLYTWRRARKKVDPPIGRRLTNAVTLTTPEGCGRTACSTARRCHEPGVGKSPHSLNTRDGGVSFRGAVPSRIRVNHADDPQTREGSRKAGIARG